MQTFFKIWHVEKFLFKNLTRWIFFQSNFWCVVKSLCQNMTRCGNFNSKSDKIRNLFSENGFLLCFSLCDWMMRSSVFFDTNWLYRGEIKDNTCYRVGRQMENRNLPHVNPSLNVWGIALWQHTIFTEVTDRTLFCIKDSRSGEFIRLHL